MSPSETYPNQKHANIIIDQLVSHGVNTFFIAPGSRSTPLVLAVAECPQAKSYVHFDERGIGFFALGHAKATNQPVAIITTSGTAVANLYPAVMEASQSHIPLILLTADRPHELRQNGEKQACDQIKLFSDYVRWQTDLSCCDPAIPQRFFATTVAQAVALSKSPHSGPVHINLAFREPLVPSAPIPRESVTPTIWEETISQPSPEAIKKWISLLTQSKKGLIIGGSSHFFDAKPIFALAKRLNWPIFPGILSPLRYQGTHSHLIHHHDQIIKTENVEPFDVVLHFGDRLISKTLELWLKEQKFSAYLQVTDHPIRQDPYDLVTHRLHSKPDYCASLLLEKLPSSQKDHPLSNWKEKDNRIHAFLSDFFSEQNKISEPELAFQLKHTDAVFFFGNSMPIRDADQFIAFEKQTGPIFANRGVSGIDGNIATAVGIAEALQKPVIAVIGDQTFLYDLNSLALLKKAKTPVFLIVINNGGGAIFSFLPIAKRKDVFEHYVAAAHDLSFPSAAELFGIPYFAPENFNDLAMLLPPHAQHSCLIEICTNRAQNVDIHLEIQKRVKECLNTSSVLN